MAEKLYERHQELASDNPELKELLEEKDYLSQRIRTLSNALTVTNDAQVEANINKLTKQLEVLNLKIERLKIKDLDDLSLDTIKAYMSYILGDKVEDTEDFRRELAKHFIRYIIIYPTKIIVGLRGFTPDVPDFELTPDFENIEKCLINSDKRRKVQSETAGSPKNKFLRTEIDTVKCLFSCSEILILLDKDYVFHSFREKYHSIINAND